jgi:glutathione synthase/RimK-type ligase-like ATP-grasp enzyme
MIVVFTNSMDVTADYVCSKLKESDLHFIRIDTDYLIEKVEILYRNHELSISIDSTIFRPQDVRSLWYRRPQSLKLVGDTVVEKGERAHAIEEWSSAFESFLTHIPNNLWINHPINNASASSKIEQLSRAKKLGLKTPKTLVTQSFEQVIEFEKECSSKLIIKPISHGHIERVDSKDDTLIYTSDVDLAQLYENRNLLSLCPSLFQEKVIKLFDVRVTIVDSDIFAIAIFASKDELQSTDIRRNNMEGVRYEAITLPFMLRHQILELCRSYQLRFAAIDLALTSNHEWIFFEINPNGQWAWLDLVGMTDIAGSLLKSMQFRFL